MCLWDVKPDVAFIHLLARAECSCCMISVCTAADDDHPVKLSPHPTFPYNYDASITLHQITESEQPQTFLEFSAEYDCDAAKAQDEQAAITTVFREGFEQLNMMLGN